MTINIKFLGRTFANHYARIDATLHKHTEVDFRIRDRIGVEAGGVRARGGLGWVLYIYAQVPLN